MQRPLHSHELPTLEVPLGHATVGHPVQEQTGKSVGVFLSPSLQALQASLGKSHLQLPGTLFASSEQTIPLSLQSSAVHEQPGKLIGTFPFEQAGHGALAKHSHEKAFLNLPAGQSGHELHSQTGNPVLKVPLHVVVPVEVLTELEQVFCSVSEQEHVFGTKKVKLELSIVSVLRGGQL